MTRGSLIALGLSAVTLAALYSQRRESAPDGVLDRSTPQEPMQPRPQPQPGGGLPIPPGMVMLPFQSPFEGTVVRPPGTFQPNVPVVPRPPNYLQRARDLIVKARRDVASITPSEAGEMANLISLLGSSGYGYEREVDTLKTLLRIRESYLQSV